MAGPGSASSAWAPLRIGLFRTLWLASLASNVGTWMQTVGAQCAALANPPQTEHHPATAVPE
jgi:hypothetical protein